MIVNDVMQQAQCEQPLEVTKVGGGKAAAFIWLQPGCGRSRALTCLPSVAETHAGKCSVEHERKKQRLEVFRPTCDAGIS